MTRHGRRIALLVSWRRVPQLCDYMVLAALQWLVSVSTLPLLAADDAVLRGWFTRSLDLYAGLGRDARTRPLFA